MKTLFTLAAVCFAVSVTSAKAAASADFVAGCMSEGSTMHDILTIDVLRDPEGGFNCRVYTFTGWGNIEHYSLKCAILFDVEAKGFTLEAGKELAGMIRTATSDLILSENGYSEDTHFYPATIHTGVEKKDPYGKKVPDEALSEFACFFKAKP